jgi:hemoglobin
MTCRSPIVAASRIMEAFLMSNDAPRINRRRTLQGMAAASAGAALASGQLAPAAAQDEEGTPADAGAAEASLYDRLGGYFAIAAVVNRFSDEIIKNPKLNENPALKMWNETEAATRLPGLKFGRTLWVAAAAGGPFEYTGLPLEEAHQEFNLTAEEFEEVGAEIVRALEYFQVPQPEIDELVAAYMQSMPDVVSSSP